MDGLEANPAPLSIAAGEQSNARSGPTSRARGSGGDGYAPAHGGLNGDARLLCQQVKHLTHVLPIFGRKLLIAEEIEDLAKDWLSRQYLGEIARQESRSREEHVPLAFTEVHRTTKAIDRIAGRHAGAAL